MVDIRGKRDSLKRYRGKTERPKTEELLSVSRRNNGVGGTGTTSRTEFHRRVTE